jgi:hypothetical protein
MGCFGRESDYRRSQADWSDYKGSLIGQSRNK